MANQEYLDILKQGVDAWNTWRAAHPDVIPDLRVADLRHANLNSADLRGANLSHAYLSHAYLRNANLRGARPTYADLNSAHLSHADLSRADLSYTDFNGADLTYTDLSYADLSYTDFNGADPNGANFQQARIGWTTFADLDLRAVKGLETVKHRGPSTIGIDTIYMSGGEISEVFLRGAGVPETFITYMRSLVGKAIEYYSCFISYSSADQEVAERLYADLRNKNVRCWYAPHDLKIGARIRPHIYEQIHFNERLLLILSKASIESQWVDYEVETALARERKEKRDILFPIRIDDAVKESEASWAAYLQETRNIWDFTQWKDHDEYQRGFTRLLRDLKE